MKLYRFTKRAYMADRVVEAGDEVLLPDDTVPGAHMIDVAAEFAGTVPGYAPVTRPVFRPDLAHNPGPTVVAPSFATRVGTALGVTSMSPEEVRAKATEDARKRAEAARAAEAKAAADAKADDDKAKATTS